MGDAAEPPVERPADRDESAEGADPWAAACAEDLAAERERRRALHGPEPTDPADELRRLADALTGTLGELGSRLPQLGPLAKPLAHQARAAIDPVIERNADAIGHLASAGQELLAAYKSAVLGQEARWTREDRPADAERPERAEPGGGGAATGADDSPERPGNRGEGDDSSGSGGRHRIDLD
ncbi:hypothetical protein SAMN06297387_101312 [Streptomyces zhaozhouensis]|uniref:DUF5304 domain-containing protein n=1 Tax=Streptomyces zhaozhouensis TaxID=1300267 RepID=A0A286DJ37_9ACTN|nr:DUF5304 family protein [Streptomyces zhaozhouensis]SOD58762.1 hypothetical protein SAMN06297387_101312 [Streptomyces zhaozhouensis]